jgi:hypothetical protein
MRHRVDLSTVPYTRMGICLLRNDVVDAEDVFG